MLRLKQEALGNKDVGKMIEYAARADAEERQEQNIKNAISTKSKENL